MSTKTKSFLPKTRRKVRENRAMKIRRSLGFVAMSPAFTPTFMLLPGPRHHK